MAHVSNRTIGLDSPVENGTALNKSSSEPELGIVVKSCTNLSQHEGRRVDSKSSLSSFPSEEFRQRSATHGGSTTSMKKLAMLRKHRMAKRWVLLIDFIMF